MKFNFTHEKTTVLPVDNQLVQVSNLPEELRNEIATYDRLMQDKLDCVYDLEKIELAGIVKLQQIQALVSQLLKKQKEDQEAAQAANQPEVQRELEKLDEKPTKKTKK